MESCVVILDKCVSFFRPSFPLLYVICLLYWSAASRALPHAPLSQRVCASATSDPSRPCSVCAFRLFS